MDATNPKQQNADTDGFWGTAFNNNLHALASASNRDVSGSNSQSGTTARIDYLSVLLRAPVDYCQQVITAVQADCAEWSEVGGISLAPRVKAHGMLPSGDRGYTLEWWGLASDCVAKLLPQHLLTQASRVDYRIENSEVSEASIDAFGRYARLNQKGNRNVQTFSSRSRAKRDGRSSGGIGVAIGSHKSDTRLSVYKRKDENGAVEIQYSGKALDDAKVEAAALMRSSNATWYEAISIVLCQRLEVQAKQSGFEDYEGLSFFLSSSTVQAEGEANGKEFEAYQFTQWYTGLKYHEQVDLLRGLHITPAVMLALLTN